MSVSIEITGLDQAIGMLESVNGAVSEPSEGLLESIETNLMPALEEAATTVWNVRTGQYAGGWDAAVTGPNMVTVSNDVEYAAPLEYGWTRSNTFVDSPGVLFPTAEVAAQDVADGVVSWLTARIGP